MCVRLAVSSEGRSCGAEIEAQQWLAEAAALALAPPLPPPLEGCHCAGWPIEDRHVGRLIEEVAPYLPRLGAGWGATDLGMV